MKIIQNGIQRYKKWNEWKKLAWNYSMFQKICILIGLKKDVWFKHFVTGEMNNGRNTFGRGE